VENTLHHRHILWSKQNKDDARIFKYGTLVNLAKRLLTVTKVVAQRGKLCEKIVNFSSYGIYFPITNLIRFSDWPHKSKFFLYTRLITSHSGFQYERTKDAQGLKASYKASKFEVTASPNGGYTGIRDLQAEILAKETLDELLLRFSFTSSKGSVWGIELAALAQDQYSAISRVPCRRGTTCRPVNLPIYVYSLGGKGSKENIGQQQKICSVVVRKLMGNPLARIAALCTDLYTGSYHPNDDSLQSIISG